MNSCFMKRYEMRVKNSFTASESPTGRNDATLTHTQPSHGSFNILQLYLRCLDVLGMYHVSKETTLGTYRPPSPSEEFQVQ